MHPSLSSNPHYFMSLANAAKARGNCLRIQVGCVITQNKNGKETLIASGYNTSPDEDCSCLHHGCLLNDIGRCVRTVHAEVNAVESIDFEPCSVTAYVTISPCVPCLEKMFNSKAKVRRVVVGNPYRPSESREWCKAHNVELIELYEEILPKVNPPKENDENN